MARDLSIDSDQLVELLSGAIDRGGASLENVPGLLAKLLRVGGWRDRVIRKTGQRATFARFEDFVTTPPLDGLGASMDLVRKLVRDDPMTLDLLDQATVGKQGAHTDNVSVSDGQGNARQYALRRLRKSAPEIHARVLTGEVSAHAGMVAAGFRRQPTPLELLTRAWAKASTEERLQFLTRVAGVPT